MSVLPVSVHCHDKNVFYQSHFFTSRSLDGLLQKTKRESNEFGNVDGNRMKLCDLLVYRPAAGSFLHLYNDRFLGFLSVLFQYNYSCLLVRDKRKVQIHLKIFSHS